MKRTFGDRARWLAVPAVMTAVISGGVAGAHQGETGPGHHADDPPAAASAQSGASESTSANGAGAGDAENTDAASTSEPEEPDPDPTVPLLILAVVLAVGTGWVAWKRRSSEGAEGS